MEDDEPAEPLRRSGRNKRPALSGGSNDAHQLVCSHCNKLVGYVTFTQKGHYEHWDQDEAMWNVVLNGQSPEPQVAQSGIEILREFQRVRLEQQTPLSPREELLFALREAAAQVDGNEPGDANPEIHHAGEDIGGEGSEAKEANDKVEDKVDDAGQGQAPRPNTHSFWYALRYWQGLFRVSSIALAALLVVLAAWLVLPAIADGLEGSPTQRRIDRALDLPSIIGNESFERMVVCPGCSTVYPSDACFETTVDHDNDQRRVHRIVHCTSMVYKNNVGIRCNEALATMVNGRPVATAHVFPYMSIELQIRAILARPGMEEHMEWWKARGTVAGTSSDVYDGEIWNEHQFVEGDPFLAGNGIALILNTDGFQPATSRNYSVDAIYLAILNLPRDLRYLRENMILVGLVPGGGEKKGLQQFAKPMVDELLRLWAPQNSLGRRVAVLLVACDVPAARSIGGFSGHAAKTEGPRRECHYPGGAGGKTYFGSNTDVADGGVVGARSYDDLFPTRTGQQLTCELDPIVDFDM
jgi:hypothetical protein